MLSSQEQVLYLSLSLCFELMSLMQFIVMGGVAVCFSCHRVA